MGTKIRYLILLFALPLCTDTEGQSDFQRVDSITYAFYLNGDWKSLILSGKEAIDNGLDYKFLRQRLGYAYFMREDYFSARKHFRKALSFDSYDPFSLEYMYYSNLNSGKNEFSGFVEKKMPGELKNSLSVRKFKPAESIETEYSYRIRTPETRPAGSFFRIGLGSKGGHMVKVFQSFSYFSQQIRSGNTGENLFTIRQPAYYLRISINVAPGLVVRSAWHYLHTMNGERLFPGNLLLVGIEPDLNRLYLSIETSYLMSSYLKTWQNSLITGFTFPGRTGFYVKASASVMHSYSEVDYVLGAGAGIRILKNAWVEATSVQDMVQGYNEFSGMYVHNSIDPQISGTGITIINHAERMSFWINFSYGKNRYFDLNTIEYSHSAILGGIKWKI